ncbi:hypothetical protein B0O80DRAFT_267188 [Mortierella sp. GBAus27b]|nr:E3 ubiquitin-protein ligase rad18 [Mortierella sp. GBA43]KAI8345704.1 hypothetical protein B0O80DRAFT_267188 [Mortierella sp. GBAus27b]
MKEDITDPLDWPAEFSQLREIDSHLRCPICKDLLRAAMMLQCHHNFCSECIRRHLDKESNCPACRVPTSTSQMRRNIALDEISNNFKDCRSLLLKTVVDSLAPQSSGSATSTMQLTRAESMDIQDSSPGQKRRRTSSRVTRKSLSHSGTQEADTDEHWMHDDDKDEDFVMQSQELPRTKNGSRSTAGNGTRSRGKNADLSNTATISNSQEQIQPQSPSPFIVTASNTPTEPVKPSTRSLVPCPVCQMAIPEAYTNTHLDKYCLKGQKDPAYTITYDLIIKQESTAIEIYERQGTTTQKIVGAIAPSGTGSPQRNGISGMFDNSASRNLSPIQNRTKNLSLSNVASLPTYPEPKRLPKLAYSVLNDKQLRKKLQELGLATHGDRQLMMKRHTEYLTIYNANCDATRSQSAAQLMKAMDVWERTYEQDVAAKEAQKRILEAQQRTQKIQLALRQKAQAESPSDGGEMLSSATPPSSQGSTNGHSGSSSNGSGVNHNNNTELAVAVASKSAFSHLVRYADEYAELVADVKRRMQADKEKRAKAEKEEAAKR